MIANVLALLLAAQSPAPAAPVPIPPTVLATSGDWVVVSIERVIAPDQHPGECFLQGRVEQVVRGRTYSAGQAVALTLACSNGGFDRTQAVRTPSPPTIQTLRSQKRALVHLDAGGRVLPNGFYGLGAMITGQPDAAR